MKKLAVFHLVRKYNDIQMLRDFLVSYANHKSGVEHDLIIIFKGFTNDVDKAAQLELLSPFTYQSYDVSDHGFDITAYISACKHYAQVYLYLCFLNSHSVIQAKNWLKILYDNIIRENVGLVGATGSWQSLSGESRRFKIACAAGGYCLKTVLSKSTRKVKKEEICDVYQHFMFLLNFDQFPNVHIRTNSFMISSVLMLEVCHQQIDSKYDAYKFESGKKGLSKTIINKGLKLLMVGSDGQAYEPKSWPNSNIYMNNAQDNLLISDNMTRKYTSRTPEGRNNLRELSWTPRHLFLADEDWIKIVNRRKYEQKLEKQKIQLNEINDGVGARIIIFGANVLGHHFQDWIKENTEKIELVGFVDSYITQIKETGESVCSPFSLREKSNFYDYILISSNEFYDEIFNKLMELKIDRSIII
ncbi:MAG: hypothetical protein ACJAU1_001141 [Psychromonas sp.]|jgi:hypothetical protein